MIVATGGISYPSTGSTGDGYRFRERNMGHKSDRTFASTCADGSQTMVCERTCRDCLFRTYRIRITDGKKKLYEEFGEMLFTHYGVTGPVILSASSAGGKKL